ncbi:MAG: DUF3486 family protein [Rhodobacteraceae bacterium]|nr:DUF3486 family protein [Paracoccaceae bacterium]
MPRIGMIDKLPESVRDELDRRLAAARFKASDDLVAWLAEGGHTISIGMIARRAAALKKQHEKDRRLERHYAAMFRAMESLKR